MLKARMEIITKNGFSADDIFKVWRKLQGGTWLFAKKAKGKYKICRRVKDGRTGKMIIDTKSGGIILETIEDITFATVEDKSKDRDDHTICGRFINWLTSHVGENIYSILIKPEINA